MSTPAEDSMFALKDVPGKGKGLFATRKITKGTRILAETPVIVIPNALCDPMEHHESISKQLVTLSDDQRQTFLSMSDRLFRNGVGGHKCKFCGIYRANALPLSDKDTGIALVASQINHACDNNAQKGWNDATMQHTVYAKQDIEEGEEITIMFLSVLPGRDVRQKILKEKFRFTCSCGRCSLPPEESRKSDERLEAIIDLETLIDQAGLPGIISRPLAVLRCIDRQVLLFKEDGPNDTGLPRAYHDAMQIMVAHGDLARARLFALRAVQGWVILEGRDGPHVRLCEPFIRDPSRHELYGWTNKWETKLDDLPKGLDPNALEDWLWRRSDDFLQMDNVQNNGSAQQNGSAQLGDGIFRNRAAFPAYAGLPYENELLNKFYTSIDGTLFKPSRQWCFLGEIRAVVDYQVRLMLSVKDVDGATVPISFHTQRHGLEMTPELLNHRNTVAIMYAEQHAFAFSAPGIRHEVPARLKILPASLSQLLALGDRVQEYKPAPAGMGKCQGCDKVAAGLKNCARCSLFCYCNATCQSIGWKEKGHKGDCKLLKDNDLRNMFKIDWDSFDQGYLEFPLFVSPKPAAR